VVRGAHRRLTDRPPAALAHGGRRPRRTDDHDGRRAGGPAITEKAEEREPMTDKKLALDKNGLQDFVDHQVGPFKGSLDKIANTDTDDGVTMNSLTGDGVTPDSEKPIFTTQHPLSIGLLATDKASGGDKLVESITGVAKSVADVYTKQIKLFGDLQTNLNNTIKKLMDGQHDTLVKIDGKIFLDGLGTLPGDFQSTGNSDQS
jgi:hypothetical protein